MVSLILAQSTFFADFGRGLLGMIVLLGACWAISTQRKAIHWPLIFGGLGLQIILAASFLIIPGVDRLFQVAADFFVAITDFTQAGTDFIFGKLGSVAALEGVFGKNNGFVFAIHVLPTIIFFSALTSVLYYWGILQRIVWACAWVMKRVMRLSGAESLAAAGEIFLGQTESPLLIKPYLATMTRSEVMALMTGGMATIAGGVMVAYIQMLGGSDPVQKALYAKFLLCASMMNAPAALVVAKLLVPETEPIDETLEVPRDRVGTNFLDALANGTSEGLKLAVNVGAMLLAFTALIAMLDKGLGLVSGNFLSFGKLLGWIFAPVAWLIGCSGSDVLPVASLLGIKTSLNEFVAYKQLADLNQSGTISPRGVFLASFALCGFANFASIGIQLGGTGSLAPNKRPQIAALGFKALFGGTVATLLSATVAGILYSLR